MRRNDVSAWRTANEFTSRSCEEGDGAGRVGGHGAGRGGRHDSGGDSYRGDAWCNGVGVGGEEGDKDRMGGRAREGPQPQGQYSALPSQPPPHFYGETAFEASQEQQERAWRHQGGCSALPSQSLPPHPYRETEFEAPQELQERASMGASFDTVECADGGAPMAVRHVAELSPSLHRHPEGWDAALMRSLEADPLGEHGGGMEGGRARGDGAGALMRTLEADPLGVHGGGMISAGVDGGGMNGAWVNGRGVNGAGMHGGGVDGGRVNGGCMHGASPPHHSSPAELLSSPAPLTPPVPCCLAATCPTHTPSHSARSHPAPPAAPPHHAAHNACQPGSPRPTHKPSPAPYPTPTHVFPSRTSSSSSVRPPISSPLPPASSPAASSAPGSQQPSSRHSTSRSSIPTRYKSQFYSNVVHHSGIISWGEYEGQYESEFYSNVVHHRGIIS
ncbi:unnamed protein product, partial [Closterium sp. Naga37s-1]